MIFAYVWYLKNSRPVIYNSMIVTKSDPLLKYALRIEAASPDFLSGIELKA
tara:strand:- start:10302 stop:10454 length:153 start_codon:yes stop_codon:yes gene_type:complete